MPSLRILHCARSEECRMWQSNAWMWCAATLCFYKRISIAFAIYIPLDCRISPFLLRKIRLIRNDVGYTQPLDLPFQRHAEGLPSLRSLRCARSEECRMWQSNGWMRCAATLRFYKKLKHLLRDLYSAGLPHIAFLLRKIRLIRNDDFAVKQSHCMWVWLNNQFF